MSGHIQPISGWMPARTARSVSAEKLRTKAPEPITTVDAMPVATIGFEIGLCAGAVEESVVWGFTLVFYHA
ncbi:hypothetical protein GCM10012320_26910 [Sinomonas cellulolyticus]|nr:hypothetical protein GCM10012320_26910 [Sinomonas sp. KCTC 49339]